MNKEEEYSENKNILMEESEEEKNDEDFDEDSEDFDESDDETEEEDSDDESNDEPLYNNNLSLEIYKDLKSSQEKVKYLEIELNRYKDRECYHRIKEIKFLNKSINYVLYMSLFYNFASSIYIVYLNHLMFQK